MKNLFVILAFLIIGCNQPKKNEQTNEVGTASNKELHTLYTPGAVKVFEDGSFISGDSVIQMLYQTSPLIIDSVLTSRLIPANDYYHYEIGTYITNNQKYAHFLIWNVQDSVKKRDFEFIAMKAPEQEIPKTIDSLRNLWMELSNAHKPEELVTSTYHEKALYYNHRPMIVGTRDIARTYGYMSRPNYKLSLKPIHIESVNESLLFEIGQCSGSYGGKYMLIWQKNDAGVWKILLDSNI